MQLNISRDNMDMNKGGIKHDDSKLRYDLLPIDAMRELVYVYTIGSYKYASRNWEKGYRWGRNYAAIKRHLDAWWNGEEIDEETGSQHLAQVAWNALALLHFALNPKKYGKWDDRPGPSEARNPEEWLEEYKKSVKEKYEEKKNG